MFSSIEDAILEIKNGNMIIVVDDEDRENEGDLIIAAEFADPEKINFMMKEARGLICVPLSSNIAKSLDLNLSDQKYADHSQCNFTASVDYKIGTSTGISAHDRSATCKALASSSSKAKDFSRPGHIFPVLAKDGCTLVRAGHTEASIDLTKLAGLNNAAVICEIINEDGTMARLPDLEKFAKKHNLKMISIKDLIFFKRMNEKLVKREVETNLETEFGNFKVVIFSNIIDAFEHIALIYGDIQNKKDVLVRVHSECMTSEVFSSIHCDCKAQLHSAMDIISKNGSGVILYMRQEGRGIGLINKLKAYNLQQNEGLDTVEANEKLGFQADLREYGIGAQILKDLGLTTIRLLTNNPKKIVGLEGHCLKVTKRIPIEFEAHFHTKKYLKTKKDKLGHLLSSV
ncbi:bifunctional 3,4-dihydroxy-2-butanone-4-phosphate synthase/GTP cyclohydrolase II [Patescibacteria group bacterium]|nr:bifunctional 3,4-dihydroxy-2-butanone-4-phosphate synthase/GTP cyclohydrolase II [Patescibacteria group bacterium]